MSNEGRARSLSPVPYRCSLCGKRATDHGNNARPLAAARCCDTCNADRVVPARLALAAQAEGW